MKSGLSWKSWLVAAGLVLVVGDVMLADEAAAARRKGVHKRPAPAVGTGIPKPDPSLDTAQINPPTIQEFVNEKGQKVYSITASQFDISPPLSEMVANYKDTTKAAEVEPLSNPILPWWRIGHSDIPDPVVQPAPGATESLAVGSDITPAAPTTGFNFTAVGISGGSPSDSNGAVGNSQFVEVVNTRYQVWSLNYGTHVATSVLGPSNINTLWSGFGGACQTQNAGDPVVLYDKIANRWLISQFTSSSPYLQCVAVSTTSSATGTYARWAFAIPSPYFGDYPKIGAWTDAYYMSAHAFNGSTYAAAIFAAMDRTKMLAGDSSATWQVILDPNEGGHLPADIDGYTPPPAGSPGIFLSNHSSGMWVYRVKVDWVTPGNTTKTLQASVPTASWTAACGGGTCIPQPGSAALLDSLADRLMFRVAYRNFVDHESVVVSHSVDPTVTGVVSGVRWYDIRLGGVPDATCLTYPCMYQQGTVADVANGRSRWMPSIAMDGAENILLGYSTTGKTANTDNQSIRYTGRAKTDPAGTMTATETIISTGTKNNTSNTRWGDYTSMVIDPIDDCTFWYTNQYIPTTTSSWGTKVASVAFPTGTGAGQCQASTCASRPASAPTIGTATTPGSNQIQISWTGISPQPGSYAIERASGACGSEGYYQPIAFTAGTSSSFTDTSVQGGVTYSYKIVAATDAGGKCQALTTSGCASATATGNCTLKPSFTGAASGTSANTSNCGIVVGWSSATSSCPLAPTMRYNIYRGTVPDFVPSAANRIATCVTGPSSYTDPNVNGGVTYYYAVRSEDATTSNGGPCNGGNEDQNAIVVSGTAYGVGTQATTSTWTDGGGDGTAFMTLNTSDLGNTGDQAWRFVSTAADSGANHTSGGTYAYRNAGPSAANNYLSSVCADMRTPDLTVGATSVNLTYWERHQLEYHWDGVAVEYAVNGFNEWNDVSAPSNSVAAGCQASDVTSDWGTLSCTGTTPANQCSYAATKTLFTGPLGSGTACASWVTSATPTSYQHRCHQITGLNPGDTIKFRWRFTSDSAAVYAGFYLDDIAVTNVKQPNSCTSNPCAGQPDGTACNDGNACTTVDTCQGGVCVGSNPIVCTASDQCHAAGVCNTQTGVCSNPNAVNGTTCSDGNACTQTDTCQSGVCVGGNSVTCTASDQCHTAGTCNQATGVCSNPTAPNGTTCSDGNLCTTGDTCQAGTCTSGAPVSCTALDQCHTAGTCNPATGACTTPTVPNGTSCNDNNACTQTDTCQSGVCSGSNPVVCTASDQCHTAGTCNTVTGTCSNPAAPNGTSCNDGNACTQTDTCQSGVCAGSSPVVCTASDQCHTAGTCNPSTGACSNPTAPNGTACSDGNACTQTDTCQSGVCAGSNPVSCTASDQCHSAGTCNPATGTCSNPSAPNGTACNDGNACTQTDTCQSGVCAGSNPVTCTASDQCHTAGTCNPATGSCSNPSAPDGTSCNDGSACTQTDACQSGVCAGSNPVTCTASDQCHTAGTCNPSTGACSNPTAPDGTSCSDGNACTQTDSCQSGVCAGSNPVVCSASDQCHTAGTCNPATGTCSSPAAPDGTSCNDGNACTQTDSCQSGVCAGSNPVICTASDQCHTAGTCSPVKGSCSNPVAPNGTACNDGNLCTQTDTCQSGVCAGSNPVICTAADQCHVAGACDAGTGACSSPAAPDGTTCNDGNGCTVNDACSGGTCSGTTIIAPAEATNVAASSDKQTFTWASVSGATQYDVVRGGTGAFPVGPGAGDEICFNDLASSAVVDAAVPAAGSGYWYLARGENTCGSGSYGNQSDGSPRVTTTCP